MSYHRVCGGKDDGKPSETESQKRVEGELHNFFSFVKKKKKKEDFWASCDGCIDKKKNKKFQEDVSRFLSEY